MTTPMTFVNGKPLPWSAHSAADRLCLAATPTFAVMAWISAGGPMTLCASGSGLLPMDGMVPMYLLMGLFHLPPWLRLASRRRATAFQPHNRTEGE